MPCIAFLGHDAIDVWYGKTEPSIGRIYACPSVLPLGYEYARSDASLSGLWMPRRVAGGLQKWRRWEISVGFPSSLYLLVNYLSPRCRVMFCVFSFFVLFVLRIGHFGRLCAS